MTNHAWSRESHSGGYSNVEANIRAEPRGRSKSADPWRILTLASKVLEAMITLVGNKKFNCRN